MQPDGVAVLRKETGFLFYIQSVAMSVSEKILVLQGFSFSGNESNKKNEEEQR